MVKRTIKEEDTNKMLRIMLRNQRKLMLAVASLNLNHGGTGSGYHADQLKGNVIEMEREWEWIARPSERIAPHE